MVLCEFLFCANPLFENSGLESRGRMARRGPTAENGCRKLMEVVMMQGL